jgi:hypothetical protein
VHRKETKCFESRDLLVVVEDDHLLQISPFKIPTTLLKNITGHTTEAMSLNRWVSNKDLAKEIHKYFMIKAQLCKTP